MNRTWESAGLRPSERHAAPCLRWLLSLCCALGMSIAPTACRAVWVVRPSPTTHALHDVCFSDANTAWAVGEGGTLLRSTDAGMSWEVRPAPGTYLLGIAFAGSLFGTIVEYENVYRTTDGGSTWVTLVPNEGFYWQTVTMVDEQTILLGGDSVPMAPTFGRSTDGGQTWFLRGLGDISHGDGTVMRLHFWSHDHGVAVLAGYGGYVLVTKDGGHTWAPAYWNPQAYLTGLGAESPNAIIACGLADTYSSGPVAYTLDGTVWNSALGSSTNWLWSVAYAGETPARRPRAIAVGSHGTIVRSDDGGQTWVDQNSPTADDLYGVAFLDGRIGVAVGTGGVILRTGNGGGGMASLKDGAGPDSGADDVIDTGPDAGRESPGLHVAPSPRPAGPWPNPFRSTTRLSLVRMNEAPTVITVLDCLGRVVRRESPTSGSPGTFVWDGRNDSGTLAAAGTYFFHIEGTGPETAQVSERVVFLGR